MTTTSVLADQLTELLGLQHPPVAITFSTQPAAGSGEFAAAPSAQPAQPAGCCFWAPAQRRRIDTAAADHANCSTGSYTHGLTDLAAAKSAPDTAALVGSGWMTPADLAAVAHLPIQPDVICYQPLATATSPDVVLIRLGPSALMTLQGACPDLRLASRPQCQIIPLAYGGQTAVSPGCAVSRARTGLPAGEMTCALPVRTLPAVIDRLRETVTADQAATGYARTDLQRF
jgi:uncharacterized protein (DUF169 family)